MVWIRMNKLRKLFRALPLAALLAATLPGLADAEIVQVQGTGQYTMSKYETIDVAQQRALKEAERQAVEQAGVYIESYTKTKDLQVVADEITAVASNILKIQDKKFENSLDQAGNITVIASIQASVDTDAAVQGLSRGDVGEITDKYNKLQAEYEAQAAELRALKDKMNTAASPQDEQAIQAEVQAVDNNFQAVEKNSAAIRAEYEGRFDEALRLYGEAIQLNPNALEPRVNRSRLLTMVKGQPQAALEDCDVAVRLAPNNPLVRYNRGYVYWQLGRGEESIAEFSEAIRLNPNYGEAYSNRGYAHYHRQELALARQDFEKAARLLPTNPDAFIKLGVVCYAQRDYQAALQAINQAIALAPNNGMCYYNRALVYQQLGNAVAAAADWQRAQSLGYAG